MSYNNKNDDNNQSSQKEITTPKKVSEPMDIVVGFQSGANRVRQYGGEVEYGRETIKFNNGDAYDREYVKYRNQNNQLTDELKTEYKPRDKNTKSLESIINDQKLATSQENFPQTEAKGEALKTTEPNSTNNNNGNSGSEGNEN